MASWDCDRESEVLLAVGSGCLGDELRQHIGRCAACSELYDVASAVVDDRRALMSEARLPGSGLVWWRANMRARQEAARMAVRTATAVQIGLVAVAILIAVVVLGATLPPIDYRPMLTIPLFAFIAWLILAPVAVYFAVTED